MGFSRIEVVRVAGVGVGFLAMFLSAGVRSQRGTSADGGGGLVQMRLVGAVGVLHLVVGFDEAWPGAFASMVLVVSCR